MEATHLLHATEARQHEMSRENIEAINLKYHDMRHQIRTLVGGSTVVDERVLDDLSHEIDVYNSVVKNRNDAPGTILTEGRLVCQRRHITLSCITNGPALGFMAPADLYSLFGNALDNAIEAVENLGDPERQSISLIVRHTSDTVSVHVESFCGTDMLFDEDGLPLASKGDRHNHGFDTRSMRLSVESYDGTPNTSVQDEIIHLNALVPLP